MSEMAAVQRRIEELVQGISATDAEINALETRVVEGKVEYEQQMQLMQEKHEYAIRHTNKLFLEEFDANSALTLHFTEAAHDACIQTLLKQQDSILEPEYIAYREELIAIADDEMRSREEAFIQGEKAKLGTVLQKEEQAYLKRVERAVNAHEERLRRLDHHEE